MVKRCRNCNQWLPLDRFWLKAAAADGLQPFCKRCSNLHRANNRPTGDGAPPVGVMPNFGAHVECTQTDPEIFFPKTDGDEHHSAATLFALGICKRCPAQHPCLEWALRNNEAGIWGGTTKKQRDQLRRNFQ